MSNEIKYTFTPAFARAVVDLLGAACRPDPEFPAADVFSLYYDTPARDLLEEKRNSDYLKTKIRCRWYGAVRGTTMERAVFLEAKRKEGAARDKARVLLPLDGATLWNTPLTDPLLCRLPEHLAEAGIPFPRPIFPMFILRYTRHRFIDPATGARIAVDTGIHVPRANPAFIARHNPTPLPVAVLEVKGSLREMPRSLHAVSTFHFRRDTFSKYLACHDMLFCSTGIPGGYTCFAPAAPPRDHA
uniref:VTC domain-containing protein n=1 Tax=Nitratidesulfovibrio vulgaris (strain DSM 19637 / Miyazaki F) TaxID=883 RepID=B8DJ74_NITV9